MKLTNRIIQDQKFRDRLIALINNIDRKQFAHIPHEDCTRALAKLLNEQV